MPTLTVREVLDIVARNQAHRSVKALAALAGIDGGNLHSSLAGRRPMPGETLRCVATAVGLQLVYPPAGDARLEPAPDTVLHLAVNADGLAGLEGALQAFACAPLGWRLVLRDELGAMVVDAASAVACLAVARYPGAYLVVHLAGPYAQEQAISLCEQIGTAEPVGHAALHMLRSAGWIRLRAGLAGVPELDRLFAVPAEPSGADWGQMLIALSRRGYTPAEVLARFGADAQVVHPGPSKELWDAALRRSGLDPADVDVYNEPTK